MKKILIVGASILQLPAILKANDLGIYTIAVDANPQAVGLKFANEAHLISTIDINEIMKLAVCRKIDGIMTLATDMPVRSVSFVANQLGLNGISTETALCATNKFEMRKRLALNNIPIPAFYKATNFKEYSKIATQFKDPFLVKPSDSSGSKGIYLVRSKKEMENAFIYAKKYSRCGEIMMEEFLTGREVSVETISIDGIVNIAAITDKITTGEPFFVEMGHSQPAQFEKVVIDKIRNVAIDAILALGIREGPSHTEIMVTNEGPKIIEIGARLGGDCIASHLVPLSTGVDLVECCIRISLGEIPDTKIKFEKGSAIRFFRTYAGQIQQIQGVQNSSNLEGIKEITVLKQEGDFINDIRNSNDRIGWVISQGENPQQAVSQCEQALSSINIYIKQGT